MKRLGCPQKLTATNFLVEWVASSAPDKKHKRKMTTVWPWRYTPVSQKLLPFKE
jgi:hypothetical protein